MKVILTEETIRKALHESIDEMILEEELLQEWGESFKKAWNGVKNAAAMYMDWRTNGQWNNKYGIYANGTGKTTEMYYLNRWLMWHLEQIKRISQNNYNPNNVAAGERKYKEINGEKVYVEDYSDYNDVTPYVSKNCSPENFNKWVGNFIKNREALLCIDNFIKNEIQTIQDLNTANNKMNVAYFLSTKYGKYYTSKKREEQVKSVNKQNKKEENIDYTEELKKIEKLCQDYSKWILNVDLYNAVQMLNNNMFLPVDFKNFLLTIIYQNHTKGNNVISNMITYDNFMKMYGNNYK